MKAINRLLPGVVCQLVHGTIKQRPGLVLSCTADPKHSEAFPRCEDSSVCVGRRTRLLESSRPPSSRPKSFPSLDLCCPCKSVEPCASPSSELLGAVGTCVETQSLFGRFRPRSSRQLLKPCFFKKSKTSDVESANCDLSKRRDLPSRCFFAASRAAAAATALKQLLNSSSSSSLKRPPIF